MRDEAGTGREGFLVLRAQTGDREALDALLASVQEPLYRYLLSLVGERQLAEDVLQETFIRVYRKLGWLREPTLFRPWAYRVATREAFRHLKRERRWAEQVRDEEALKTLPAPPTREEFAAVSSARLHESVAGLSPASRAVVVLYYLHELSLGQPRLGARAQGRRAAGQVRPPAANKNVRGVPAGALDVATSYTFSAS